MARVNPKREFEDLLLSIRKTVATNKNNGNELLDEMIEKTRNCYKNLKWYQQRGSASTLGFTVALGILSVWKENPKIFEYSKFSDFINSTYFGPAQNDEHSMLQEIQTKTTEWNTTIQGYQSVLQNLDAALTRLQQLEDAAKR